MSNKLGPLDLCCDSPPYMIVRACGQVGFYQPEDVGWRRLERMSANRERAPASFGFFSWTKLLTGGQKKHRGCICHSEPPILEKYTFLLNTGREFSYHLGQCERCWTIFWESA